MQKSLIAIFLALALTNTFADYSVQNYVKSPVEVASDNETIYTNSNFLTLASITSGNIYILSGNSTPNANVTASSWSLFYRQLNIKTLAVTQNSTAYFTAPVQDLFFCNNYAVGLNVDTDNNITNLRVYQSPLVSGKTSPGRIQLSNNNNSNFLVEPMGIAQIGNIIYVSYYAASNTANITSFTVGATSPGAPLILSSTFDTANRGLTNTVSLAWGESLGSSQLFATWQEAGVLKDAIINVSKGTVTTPTPVPGFDYTTQQSCKAFATDSKFYGEFCLGIGDYPNEYIIFWIRTYGMGNNALIKIANYTTTPPRLKVLFHMGHT